jgi:hypothetical protein
VTDSVTESAAESVAEIGSRNTGYGFTTSIEFYVKTRSMRKIGRRYAPDMWCIEGVWEVGLER